MREMLNMRPTIPFLRISSQIYLQLHEFDYKEN